MESDQLICSLPGVKWAEKALSLGAELQDECISYIVAHFSEIISTEGFHHLLKAQGMSSKPYLLEKIFQAIEASITTENCCSYFIAIEMLKTFPSVNDTGFACEIQAVHEKLWTFLVQSFYAVRHSEGWNLMKAEHREQIQADLHLKGYNGLFVVARVPSWDTQEDWRRAHAFSRPRGGDRPGCCEGHGYRAWKLDPVGARGHCQGASQCLESPGPHHFRHTRKCWGEEDWGHRECFRVHSWHFRHTGECRWKIAGKHLEHTRVAIKRGHLPSFRARVRWKRTRSGGKRRRWSEEEA
ncbi:K1107 protein, partial [Polypterus senegalus]